MRLLVYCYVWYTLSLASTTALPDASQRQEFISAMQRMEDKRMLDRHNQEIQERLRRVAIRVIPEVNRQLNEGRELYSNYYSGNNNNGNNNGNQYNGVNEYASKYYNYQSGSGQSYYEPIDLSEYAFKYVGCQDIATWSDYRASAGQTPTAMRRFVTFRLCEANACSTYNKYGCNNNYGEYVIPMEEYLDIMTTYHYKQYSRYCQTCDACSKFDYTLYLNKVAAYQSYVNQMKKQNQNSNSNGGSSSSSSSNTNNDDAATDDDTATDDAGTNDDTTTDDATTDDATATEENDGDGDGVTYDDALGYNYGAYGYNIYDDAFKTYSGADDDTSNQIGDDFWNQYVWHYGGADNDDNNGGRRLSYSSSTYSSNGATVYNKNFGNYVSGGYYGGNVPAPKLPWYIASDGSCVYKSACQNFKSACRAFNSNATNYMPYFSCKAFQMGNAVSYVGPHCRSDGHTIGIALYKDQYCSSYVGDVSDIEKYTDKKFDDSELSLFYDKSCISCKASESYSLATSTSSSSSSRSSAQDTYPFCTVAYETSAKCNTNFKSSNALYENDENQNKVCTFIKTLIENHYNEHGQIVVKEDFRFSKWNSGAEYISLAQKASPIQLILLVTTMATALSLLIYAAYLYKKLMYRMPWRPPKSVHSPTSGGQSVAGDYDFDTRVEAGRISRINSGITALRSVSHSYDGHSVSAFSQLPIGAPSGQATNSSVGIVHGDLTYNARARPGIEEASPSAGQFA